MRLQCGHGLPTIEAERGELLDRLKNIEFSMVKLNLSSGSARQDLFELITIIKRFQDETEASGFSLEELNKILQERVNSMVEWLEKLKDSWLSSWKGWPEVFPAVKIQGKY